MPKDTKKFWGRKDDEEPPGASEGSSPKLWHIGYTQTMHGAGAVV